MIRTTTIPKIAVALINTPRSSSTYNPIHFELMKLRNKGRVINLPTSSPIKVIKLIVPESSTSTANESAATSLRATHKTQKNIKKAVIF